ncbi:RNA polymerase sigma factor [Ornithinibacillus halophilus]|uniref:RNA polymerase sigma factor n=1 Tax=Ornithinibacillus halophilus TaxID=930117 RepID=A0A1M5L5X5_9BACI|nr:RNA polymerase sigma factor [Ornithinibacillus halophilus]SHG60345.1 RNA polymerase sigma-70 factor, ECF subfamily [Ornithinibacillus halophilus]
MDKEKIITDWFYQFSDEIYNFLLYRIGKTDVEDLVQEVFIRAMNGIENFHENSSPKTWLYSIAKNLATDEIRRRNRKKWKTFIPFKANHEPSSDESPDRLLQLNEEKKMLYEAILSLRPSYKDVLILRGIQSHTVKETAEILGWSENKVRSTYYRSKKALKNRLGGNIHE